MGREMRGRFGREGTWVYLWLSVELSLWMGSEDLPSLLMGWLPVIFFYLCFLPPGSKSCRSLVQSGLISVLCLALLQPHLECLAPSPFAPILSMESSSPLTHAS